MNVFILLLTTVSAGQRPAPPPPAAHAAPVASSCGGGCGSCGAVSDCCVSDCCSKPKRCRTKKSKDCCCEVVSCAPACPTPCAQPTCAPACGATSCCQPANCTPCCQPTCCEKPKKKCFFSRSKKCDCCEVLHCDSCNSCGSAPAAPALLAPAAPAPGGIIINPAPAKPAEPIKKMPSDANKGASLAPLSPISPAAAKVETEAKNPFDSDRRHEPSVGHTANYGRLTGQLSYVRVDGGLWVLRYAPLSQEDANGGSVILARDRSMSNYKEGDLVTVEGRVISEKGSTRLGGPLYQVQAIRLVDRPSN